MNEDVEDIAKLAAKLRRNHKDNRNDVDDVVTFNAFEIISSSDRIYHCK